MHLRDMEKIYQKMAGNSLLAPTYRVIAKNLMLNESTGYFDGIIDQEAASLNRTAFASSFKNRVYMAYKGGSYSCQGDAFRSNSGMLQLPTYGGAYKRIYTYGIFLDRTISSAYTSGTITSATRELLRPAIRAALLTWNNGNSSSAVINLEKDVQAITSLSTKSMGSQEGINAINSAKAELETATPNYLLVANNLYNAVNQLKAQKGNHSNAETLNDLVKHAIEITKDLQAYVVSTGDGEGLGELSKNLDSEITSAQTKVAKGDYLGAMENCLNAAKIGNDRIDWSLQNIAYEDETLGFGSEKAVSELAIVPTKLLQVEAWPNPANSELSLKIELENPSDIHVEIMDLQGRLLAKQFVAKADNRQGETIRFQVQDFPAGTVMVKVVTNDNVITKKVTILH
ncbi:MAG TPA: T9SS type A sorting domain-containing protein [Bacteroidetes bacterium]|nr:T9SS type A sorting domain-containing protein [Bacteroidota bacterium]